MIIRAQLARLESQGARMQARAGEILVEMGDSPRGVFVVAGGVFEVDECFRATRRLRSAFFAAIDLEECHGLFALRSHDPLLPADSGSRFRPARYRGGLLRRERHRARADYSGAPR